MLVRCGPEFSSRSVEGSPSGHNGRFGLPGLFAKCWFACGAGLVLYREWPVVGNFILTMPMYI